MIGREDELPLIVGWASGDQRAFETLFRRYRPAVRSLCGRWLRDAGDAEEATQETFLKACRGIGTVDPSCVLDAWLRRIARNVCIDQLRRRARRPVPVGCEEPLDQRGEPGPDQTIAGGDPRLQAALDGLAPQHRTVIQLRFLGGFSHREIAEALEKSPPQVKALLHRARVKLVEEWDRAASAA